MVNKNISEDSQSVVYRASWFLSPHKKFPLIKDIKWREKLERDILPVIPFIHRGVAMAAFLRGPPVCTGV